jgi:hypothetical protein
MSVKEKFDEIIGLPFEFRDDNYPEYIFAVGPSRFIALIDLAKFSRKLDWKPFVIRGFPEKGHVYFKDEAFSVSLIRKAIYVIKPNEYDVYKELNMETNVENYILALKNGNYGVIIASALGHQDQVKKKLEDYVKEPPKSVFIL